MQLGQMTDIFDVVDAAAGIVKRISAIEAYRKYSWLQDAPGVNVMGNYRGMVINANWKSVYLYSSSIGEKAGNIAILLSVASEMMQSRERITSILNSNEDRFTKAARLSSQASGISLRVLSHLAVGAISNSNWVLKMTRKVNPAFWLDQKQFMETLDSVDRFTGWLNARTDSYLSGDNIYYFTTLVAEKLVSSR